MKDCVGNRGCGIAGVHGHLQKLSSDILEPTSTKPSEFAGSSMCRSPQKARPSDLGVRIRRDYPLKSAYSYGWSP